MRRLIALAALVALPLLPIEAAAPSAASPPGAEEMAKLKAIVVRGRLLFDLDRAAWVATDDFLKKVRDPGAAGYKGYVVDRQGDGFVVTFFGGDGDRLIGRYIAQVSGGRVTSSRLVPAAEQKPLTPIQLRMAKARSLSPGPEHRPCTSGTFNATIIPLDSLEAPLEMYLTSPQTEGDSYPFGGHFLLTVSPDGNLVSVRKFANSCLTMKRPPALRGNPGILFVTHIVDPLPTEMHVYLSILAQQPIVVGVVDPQRVWLVTGAGVEFVDMPLDPPPARRRRN